MLQPPPRLEEPFAMVISRRVLAAFEGRRYSVPFRSVGRHVEVLGTHAHVSFRPLDRHEVFFRLVSARYKRGSIVLTSNMHVRDWPEIFAGDQILTTAILDRLLHHVHIVHIDGRR